MADEPKEAAPKPKSKKGLIIAVAATLLMSAGGAGAWFMLGGAPDNSQAAEEAHRKKELKSRVFVNLEPFTVNLADDEDRFAQVAVVLEVINGASAEDIKTLMPSVRNKVLLLLSSKRARDLLSVEGKEILASQIADATARVIGWTPPKAGAGDAPHGTDADKDSAADPDAAPDAEQDAAGRKDAAAGKDAASGKDAKAKSPASPVSSVHFSQFIIQ
jgi:flagellar FliL protein